MSDVKEYKCPNCGGALRFDSASQMVVCPYCDAQFDAEAMKAFESNTESYKEETNLDQGSGEMYSVEEAASMSQYRCQACGGEIIADANTSATACPYCGSPVLMKDRLSGALKPEYVIPFQVQKEECEGLLKNYMKNKLLLHPDFKKNETISEVKGLYAPYWLYDASVNGCVVYRCTTVHKWSDSEYNYTETKYYDVTRIGDLAFDHLPVDGSKMLADDMMESIEPFDFNGVKDFMGSYLTGYLAERYDVSKEETQDRALTRFRDATAISFRSSVTGYDTVTTNSAKIQTKQSKVHYAMYPIWLLNIKWKEKNYQFAVNGQTGKISGNLPMFIPFFIMWYAIITIAVWAVTAGLCAILFATDNESINLVIILAIIGLVGGLVAGFFFTKAQKKKLKGIQYAVGAAPYIRENSRRITYSNSTYLYKNVTRSRRSSSSSSSHHSSHRRH